MASEPVAMEVDTIRECKGNEEKEDGKGSTTNKPESLALREPDHEVVRMKEDPDMQDYWETGRKTESTSAPKIGNADHMQISCYHLGRKGHIKATGPAPRKLGPPPWTRRPWPRARETLIRKGHSTGGGKG